MILWNVPQISNGKTKRSQHVITKCLGDGEFKLTIRKACTGEIVRVQGGH